MSDLRNEFYAHCARPSSFRCPCCDHLSLASRGDYDICEICYWEDDGTDDVLYSTPFSPNHMTLAQGRLNYKTFGACTRAMLCHVKMPSADQAAERAEWLKA